MCSIPKLKGFLAVTIFYYLFLLYSFSYFLFSVLFSLLSNINYEPIYLSTILMFAFSFHIYFIFIYFLFIIFLSVYLFINLFIYLFIFLFI